MRKREIYNFAAIFKEKANKESLKWPSLSVLMKWWHGTIERLSEVSGAECLSPESYSK